MVPDILYSDFRWLPEEQRRMRSATYAQQRDYLRANLHHQSIEVVLPLILHFPGTRQQSTEDARVIGYASAAKSPLAAISIPGAAYVGRVKDMIPTQGTPDFEKYCLTETDSSDSQYLLSEAQSAQSVVKNVQTMYERIVGIFNSTVGDDTMKDAVVFYEDVMDMTERARNKDKSDYAATATVATTGVENK